MLLKPVCCLLLGVQLISAQLDVDAAFRSAGIETDVIDRSPPPAALITVTYPNASVLLGNELTPTQVRNQPMVLWSVANLTSSTYHTLIMVDPDYPSRSKPVLAELKHWLVGNILGNDIRTGEVIADYLGPIPEFKTYHHRYVFLVYEQPLGRIDYSREPRSPNGTLAFRPEFSTRNFTRQYNLGDPIAGNYFIAQYDATVDEIRTQWGIPPHCNWCTTTTTEPTTTTKTTTTTTTPPPPTSPPSKPPTTRRRMFQGKPYGNSQPDIDNRKQ